MAWLLLLTACLSPSEEGFAEDYATHLCRYDEHCHKSAFLETYDDVEECVDEVLDLLDESVSCSFDKDEARDCLVEMRDARQDCDEGDRIPRPCYEAFDCPGVLPSELSQETFYEAYFEAYCATDCDSPYTSQICDNIENYTTTEPECPDFDLEKALECVDPANWECTEGYGYEGSGGFPRPPQACNEVCYSGYGYDYTY